MGILQKMFANVTNQKVLNYLKISPDSIKYFKSGDEAGSPFDEGSQVLFYTYAAEIPSTTKHTIGLYNLLINPENGQIFAFQWGRFTFVIRCDFTKADFDNTAHLRKGRTADDWVDFRVLGDNWALLDKFIDEEKEQLEYAYLLSKNQKT